MTAAEPSRSISVDISSHNGNDVSELTDHTTCLTDENEAISCVKVGKVPDDAERVEFTEDKANLAAGDTITIHHVGLHNWGTTALYPYDGAASVDDSNKITQASGTDPIVVTLTAGFITALFDQGSGKWAFRLLEDGVLNDGDIKVAEIDADLTTVAAGPTTEQIMAAVRPGSRRPAFLSLLAARLEAVQLERWPGVRFIRQHTDLYAQALAGTLSFAGALQLQVSKLLAGALSFAGNLQKQVNKPVAGSISFAGALQRQINKPTAGSLSFGGDLQRQVNKGLAGVLSFAGDLATLLIPSFDAATAMAAIRPGIQRAPLLAILAAGGAQARIEDYDYQRFVRQHTDLYSPFLTGSLSFTGDLQRQTEKQVAGTLSFTGILQRQTNKGLAGVLSFSGDLLAELVLNIAQRMAAVRPGIERAKLIAALASDLERERLRDWPRNLFKRQHTDLYSLFLTGALSFAGALQRQTNKQVVGSLSFAGALQKQTNKVLAGALSFVGDLVTLFIPAIGAAQFMAAIRPGIQRNPRLAALVAAAEARETNRLVAGLYTRRNLLRPLGQLFFQVVAGVLSFSGALQRQTNKAVSGVLSFAGGLVKTTLKNLAGALSFAGALSRTTLKNLSGSLTFTGALATLLNPLVPTVGNLVLSLRRGGVAAAIRKGLDALSQRKGGTGGDLKNR